MQIFTVTILVNLKVILLMYLSANKDLKKENLKLMKTIKSRNKKNARFQNERNAQVIVVS